MTDSEADEIPRHLRTPITEAGVVLSSVSSNYSDLINSLFLMDIDEGYFIDKILPEIWNDEDTTGESVTKLLLEETKKCYPDDFPNGGFYPFFIAATYAVQALKIYEPADKYSDSNNLAWSFISDARYWLGITIDNTMYMIERMKDKKIAVEKMAAVRHAENRAIKKTVFEFYEANIDKFKSKDHAAESIAGKIVPVKFRTVRSYIDEFHKKKTAS